MTSTIRRAALEFDVLKHLSARPAGASLGDLRRAFDPTPIAHVVEHLVRREQVRAFPGSIFGLTEFGRSRIGAFASTAKEGDR